MLLQSIFAFCAIIGFSVLIEAPKRCLVVNGILGMAGWAIYLYTNAGHDHTYTGNTYDSAGSRNV